MLVSVVVLFVVVNTVLTLLTANRRRVDPSNAAHGPEYNSTSKRPRLSDSARYIVIDVLSSKDRVRICVDDATVMFT